MAKMLKEHPHSLVKFQVYSTKGETTYEDRRLNRVKTKNAIPFGPWAKMIVESILFVLFFDYIILYYQKIFAGRNFRDSNIFVIQIFSRFKDFHVFAEFNFAIFQNNGENF